MSARSGSSDHGLTTRAAADIPPTAGPAPAWLASAATLALGAFAMGTDSFVVAGILPEIARGLETDAGQAGQAVSVFALTYALAAPVLATVTSHFSRKALMVFALTTFVAANILSAEAPTLPALLAARVLAGLAAAAYTPTASAAAAALAGSAQRGRAIATILGGLTVGTVFGVPVGTWIGHAHGWRASLLYVAAIASVATVGVLLILPKLPRPAQVPVRDRLEVLRQPQVDGCILVMLLGTAGSIMVYTFIASILTATAHTAAGELPVLLILWGLGGTIGAFGSGWLADRVGARRAMAGALLLLTTSLAVLPLVHSTPVAGLALVINGCAGWAMSTPSNHHLTGLLPHLPSVAISYNSSAIYAGQAVGVGIGGLLLAHGCRATVLCPAAAGLAGIALALWLVITTHGARHVSTHGR